MRRQAINGHVRQGTPAHLQKGRLKGPGVNGEVLTLALRLEGLVVVVQPKVGWGGRKPGKG